MPNDKTYSNEAPHGPTLEELAGTGTGPPGGGDAPATGVASAPGGGTIDAALVGTSTEILGAGSDGGGADEPNTLQTGTAQTDLGDGGDDGFGGRTMDTAARNATMPSADTGSRSVDD